MPLATALPPAVSVPAGWPAALHPDLVARRAAISPRGSRVLDLADPAARARVTSGESQPVDQPYDAVISVGAFATIADLPGAIRTLLHLLTPEGELFFVEPVGAPGWARLLLASAAANLAPVRDQHLDRDVPLAVRSNGFVITDLERFSMPTAIPSLRRFVAARAVHAVPHPGSGS